MSESQFSIAGILFLITVLCACGGKPSFEALTSASVASTDTSKCDDSSTSESSVIALCHVDSDSETHQVCTDASTAMTKYGLDSGKPNQPGTNGTDHLGAC